MSYNIKIAIDGTAASGKGTLAKRLCEEFKFAYLDTGKLYRLVAYITITENIDYTNSELVAEQFLNYDLNRISSLGTELKGDEIGKIASVVASYQSLRKILLKYQQDFANKKHHNKKGVILDGRDIGTVVLPNAHIKFYVDASIEIRAERRWKELISLGQSTIKRNVLEDLRSRDKRDSQRKISPLLPASDAILLDTTNLDADEVFDLARKYIVNYLN
jgi:cytidylate kinase